MIKFYSDILKEMYYVKKLNNGLIVQLMPKKDYIMSYGLLTVKYGALDNEFIPYGEKEYVKVPLGIAHFMEHKMFEMPNGVDVNEKFADLGADVNAFTTYNQTAYYFTTTRNFQHALTYLLELVNTKGYSNKSIKEEIGIIEQELLMYLDNPDVRLSLESNKTMYKDNPITEDIGGTPKSIRKINKKLLDLCYDNFYHPSNMILTVVGNFDLDETLNLIEHLQINSDVIKVIDRKRYYESAAVFTKYRELTMDVSIPKVSVNLKVSHENLSNIELVKLDYALSMIMHQNFDITSDFYEQAEKSEIINNSFDFDITIEEEYRHISITSDTNKPQLFIEKIKNKLLAIKEEAVSEEDFERYKKIARAQIIRRMNSIEYLGSILAEAAIHNIEFFTYLNIINELTMDDVKKARNHFIEEAISVVLIKRDE